MTDIKKIEKKFTQYGWDKYIKNLYEWYLQGKDLKKLVQTIEKIEGENIPLPNIKTDGEAEIICDKTGCNINAKESTNIWIGAQDGRIPKFDGKRAWTERNLFCYDESEKE